MNKKHVLIFPSGAENAINVYDSLKYNIHFELFGATSRMDHSAYMFDDKHLSVDNYMINAEDFFDKFNKMLDAFKIDFIIPTHDEIIMFLMKNSDKINATIISSPYESCLIAFGKISTFNKLKNSWYLPKTYKSSEKITYPVFIKPNHGAGGKGALLINNKKELLTVKNINQYLISEYLPGDELTVDCFTNKNGELLFIGPRTRNRITSGISFNSETVELTDEIRNIAIDINSKIKFRGLWFFQVKKNSNSEYKLMEISVRTAGTMALYRQLGVNFAALSLFDFMDYDVEVIVNNYNIQLDRYYKCNYMSDLKYDCVYIDFDDTIIVNEKVNLTAMMFLYQCMNKNIDVYLLTKHSTSIDSDLDKWKISKKLFKSIIHIEQGDKKVNYVKHNNAIFIDNYFPERRDVYYILNIPVFDVDAIESLLDSRGN